MSFFINRPDILTPIQWFFAADTAVTLPFPTRFGSGNWASERWAWPGPGEVLPRNRRWVNGAANPDYTGLAPCGTADQFLNGTLYPPGPFPRTGDGVPICCLPIPPCAAFYGFFGVVGGYMQFSLAGFLDDPLQPSSCSNLATFNGSSDPTRWDCFVADGCSLAYVLRANPFFAMNLLLDDTPNVTLQILTNFGTSLSLQYVGTVPLPVSYPVTFPLSVTLTEDGTGLCSGLGLGPTTLSLSMQPRYEVGINAEFDLTLNLSAHVV